MVAQTLKPFLDSNLQFGAWHINTNLDGETFQYRSSIFPLPTTTLLHLHFSPKTLDTIIMGNTRLKNMALVLFLFFILQQQSVFVVEGRHLRSTLCENHTSGGDGMSDDVVHEEGSRRVEYEVDDFRPTTPGHSPGVGHSINN